MGSASCPSSFFSNFSCNSKKHSLFSSCPAVLIHRTSFWTRISSPVFRCTTSFVQSSSKSTKQGMAGVTGSLNVHSLRNCKIIHLVRHAQGYHNVAGEENFGAYMSHEFVDSSITPLGWNQVDHLRSHLERINLISKVELVVTSPMMRTMQTAVGAFGGPQLLEGDKSPPLMLADSGGSGRPAVSKLGCPPFVAVELCREHLGVHPCDKRQSISLYRNMFPGIDFTETVSDEDTLWKPDIRETDPELIERGRKFLEWVSRRKEREIAVVSHSGFLSHLLSVYGETSSSPIQKELRKGFSNCEMRTIVLVNEKDLGDSIPEDYPGGVPPGKDVPSEAFDEKAGHSNGQ